MAIVQGIREKVHLPIYDCLKVEPGKQLREAEPTSTLKFFINVQDKTKLLTNLQSASLLPHYNTFEARAMRVIISDLPPEFPDPEDTKDAPRTKGDDAEGYDVTDSDGNDLPDPIPGTAPPINGSTLSANLDLDLKRVMGLLREARESVDKEVTINADDDDVTLIDGGNNDAEIDIQPQIDAIAAAGDITLTVPDLEALAESMDKKSPPLEQIRPNDGAGTVIGKLIYNTVTTFFVGEKVMIQMPTWNFPGGAGAFSLAGKNMSHGEPTPLATFRFAEPIYIDKQQNFRVEMEVPDADDLKEIQKTYGPLFIWIVLDGYMTRGVQ
jgi:hypothetical protein